MKSIASLAQEQEQKQEEYPIRAKANFKGTALEDIVVLNPGDWFGKTWLIEIGGSYWPTWLIVEADNVSDAIDELAENEKYGHNITVAEEDLGDYDPDDCSYGPNGEVLDLDHLMVYGKEGHDVGMPYPCRYYGPGVPDKGCTPLEYQDLMEDMD